MATQPAPAGKARAKGRAKKPEPPPTDLHVRPIQNAEIAAAFDEIADLLEIEGANVFRVRAYRTAARTIESFPRSASEMVGARRDLGEIPGVGPDLAGKITEMATTGSLAFLAETRARVGAGLAALLRLPGLGPKRVRALRDELGVMDLDGLQRVLDEGRVAGLKRFGAKTEEKIRAGLERARGPHRFRLDLVEPVARSVVARLIEVGRAAEAVPAGSFRRRKETVGDLDIVATGIRPALIMDALATHPDVARVLAKGETKSMVELRSGLQVDVRVVPRGSFGAALHYFTGNKDHNIAVRRRGQLLGLKVNEYGVFREEHRIGGSTEASVYKAVGLPVIPPELRENLGEIEAAEAGALPRLIEEKDVRGDLQCHTTDSDGRSSLEEVVAAARARGLEYLAITDHSPHPRVARGLDVDGLREQGRRIDAMNRAQSDVTVLKGVEVEILRDGTLDLPADALQQLDIVVASVHEGFQLSEEEQTRRVARALEDPNIDILGHPTGRILGDRPGLALDFEKVLKAAREHGCVLELNAQPERLDLPDTLLRRAKMSGVKVSIGTDAHDASQLAFLRFGVDQARRGWLEPRDVVNTLPLADLRRLLARRA